MRRWMGDIALGIISNDIQSELPPIVLNTPDSRPKQLLEDSCNTGLSDDDSVHTLEGVVDLGQGRFSMSLKYFREVLSCVLAIQNQKPVQFECL
ncbi:MAG: hypothetical protein P4L53_23495 [Candidatus Obscuribacterales bacterium]|nr:hypothetical protein [Candidatus Obscuribacterales bacterium]